MRWRRTTPLPPDVRAGLPLGSGERVLAQAALSDGRWLVGTESAAYLPAPEWDGAVRNSTEQNVTGRDGPGGPPTASSIDGGAVEYRRLPWEQIERAAWQPDDDVLRIVEVVGYGRPEVVNGYRIDEPGEFLELLRERVTRSVVCTLYANVRGKRGLTVVGRRTPTGRGDVVWSYVFAAGLDPDDPEVARIADETLARGRSELGLG